MSAPAISIVVPLYNESLVFNRLIDRLNKLMDQSALALEVVLIDDGSRDNTAALIRETASKDSRYQGILLSRNHGHQLALTAGLHYARGTEAVMIIDGDLQDPPELLTDFYNKLSEGYDVVYAVREKRKEGPLKKLAYWTFYRIQRSVTSTSIPLDSGDFGMLSRRVVEHLKSMPEESRYLRGMRSWVGFKQAGITYERQERAAGTSNYSVAQLFKLAYNGIFNFSEAPIKFITRMGIFTISISLIYLAITLYRKFFVGDVPLGFTALIMAIVLFSGVQLISIGIIGEYVVRIFFQVKNRPLFIVSEHISEGKTHKD
jgi:glycosyltransferase involved in cell wall biosynthesis